MSSVREKRSDNQNVYMDQTATIPAKPIEQISVVDQCSKKTLVSVIMGVYCSEKNCELLERSVQSILAQSLQELELLICDDGSCEAARTLLDHFAYKDSRIRLLRPGNVIMLPQKLNYCLLYASGNYIARMDDDDFSDPMRLEKQVAYLEHNSQVAFVGCNVKRIFSSGKWQVTRFPAYPKPEDFRFTMPFIHPTLVFRREALMSAGGYSEKEYCLLCEDYDLLLRLYALGMKGVNLQEVLFDYSMAGVEQKRRRYKFRVNEAIVRYLRFRELGMLPQAFPHVIKPLVVGLIPQPLLNKLRQMENK